MQQISLNLSSVSKLDYKVKLGVGFFRVSKNLSIAMGLYCFILLFLSIQFWVSDSAQEIFSILGLHLASIVALYVFGKLEPWGGAKYHCFGGILLCFAIFFRWAAVLNILMYGLKLERWPLTIPVDGSYLRIIYTGEIITTFGILLLVAVWKITMESKIGKIASIESGARIKKYEASSLYILTLITQFLLRILHIDFGGMAQIVSALNFLGIVSIYIFSINNNIGNVKFKAIIKAFFLALPLVILALKSGMKEAFLMPLIPMVYLLWNKWHSFKWKLLLIVCGSLILSLSQFYVKYLREESWGSHKEYSTIELLSGAGERITLPMLMNSSESMLSRIDLTLTHAFTVAIKERDGVKPIEVFASIPLIFIPRILWPEKPAFQPGSEHTRRILNSNISLSEISTATAAGFFTEYYLGGGLIALVLGIILYGYLVARLQIMSFSHLSFFGQYSFNLMLCYTAIRLDENSIIYSYAGVILFFLIAMLTFKGLKILQSKY